MITEDKKIIASVCWYGLEHIDSGGKVRAFNLLRHMREFIPWVIAPGADKRNFINAVAIKGRPLKIKRLFNGEIFNCLWPDKIWQIKKRLKEINPDVVQAEGIWAFPAVHYFCRSCRKISILAANNIEYRVAKDLYGEGWRAKLLKAIERYCYSRADILVVCSNEDKMSMMIDFSIAEDKIIVMPNGVEGGKDKEYEHMRSDVPHLLFMGKLDYGPNREAVAFIKKLMQGLNNMKCMIIGSG